MVRVHRVVESWRWSLASAVLVALVVACQPPGTRTTPTAGYPHACGGREDCTDLDLRYERAALAAPQAALVAGLHRKACDDGVMSACTDLGVYYVYGTGVPRDAARAAVLFQRACDRGSRLSCYNLGVLYSRGVGVAENPAAAAPLYRSACDRGVLAACNNLGVLHVRGAGVAREPGKAAALYERACNGREMLACANLGRLHERGLGVVENLVRESDRGLARSTRPVQIPAVPGDGRHPWRQRQNGRSGHRCSSR